MTSESMKDVALLILNIISTVGIVLVNKLVLNSFPYAMTLTFFHQLVMGILLMWKGKGFFPEKPMPMWAKYWITFLSISTIYLLNLSLGINTVTLYQMAKLLNIPTQCLWQYFRNSKVYSIYVYGSLVVLTLGVGLATVADLSHFGATFAGILVAAAGVIATVIEQAEVSRIKNELDMNTMDFLHAYSLHRIFACVTCMTILEPDAFQKMPQLTLVQWMLILLSCFFALSINVTLNAMLGKFGAVTTAVVGHLKTCSIVSLGFFLHPPLLDVNLVKNVTGISIALFGAMKYGQYSSFPDADCFAICRSEKDCEEGEDDEILPVPDVHISKVRLDRALLISAVFVILSSGTALFILLE